MKLSCSNDGIYYLYEYYPVRFEEHHGISERIIAFKNGEQDAVSFFCNEVQSALDQLFQKEDEFTDKCVVCIVPSHEKNKYGKGLMRLAAFLADTYEIVNEDKLIIMQKDRERNAGGGERSLIGQLETLKVRPGHDIQGKIVLVLDDITTSGNTIEAVRMLLMNCGANEIVPVVLGRTTYPEPPHPTIEETMVMYGFALPSGLQKPYEEKRLKELVYDIDLESEKIWNDLLIKTSELKLNIPEGKQAPNKQLGQSILLDIRRIIIDAAYSGIADARNCDILNRRYGKIIPDDLQVIADDYGITVDEAGRIADETYELMIFVIIRRRRIKYAEYTKRICDVLETIPVNQMMPIMIYLGYTDNVVYKALTRALFNVR